MNLVSLSDAGQSFSAAVWGVDAYAIEVEVNATYGKMVIVVVGLPDTAVKESRDGSARR